MGSTRKHVVIDPATCKIDRSIFSDQAVYDDEMEKIFGRAWLMIGHESLVPAPDDFFHTYMGQDPRHPPHPHGSSPCDCGSRTTGPLGLPPKGAERAVGRASIQSCLAVGDPVKTNSTRAAAVAVAPTPVALPTQQALWLELMQFYIREAWLLDERKLDEWLDLFSDDVL